MDILDHPINRRIMEGNLPDSALFPVPMDDNSVFDIAKQAESGLSILKENPELVYFLFKSFEREIQVAEDCNQPDLFISDVNSLINTNALFDSLNNARTQIEARELIPVITTLDKVLWCGASAYQFDAQTLQDSKREQATKMMYAWLYLLILVQKKEAEYQYTIDLNTISPSTQILLIITSEWVHGDTKCLRKLTKRESNEFDMLTERRKQLRSKVSEENKYAKLVAEQTDAEWSLFLKYINDLSQKERYTIEAINSSNLSKKDKTKAILNYNSALFLISRGRYILDGDEIDLVLLFEKVNKRLNAALLYCYVSALGKEPFIITPLILTMAMGPQTFNYLFIVFHHFRLSPKKEEARNFFSQALISIKRNLGEEKSESISIDEMISAFHTIVTDFVRKNQDVIDGLEFTQYQNDSVSIDGFSVNSLLVADCLQANLTNKLDEIRNNKEYDTVLNGGANHKDVLSQLQSWKNEEALATQKIEARRIIISLNIIYLFCEGLRIVTIDRRTGIVKDVEKAKQFRYNLLKLDEELVSKVYEKTSTMEMGMLERREKAGIIPNYLSEQEDQEEQLRNTTYLSVLTNSISALVDCLNGYNKIEELLEIKSQIRQQIYVCPDCDAKEQSAEWLDSIIERICGALVRRVQLRESDFTYVKKEIRERLGEFHKFLPAEAIDSLATAEMLYSKYALKEYAENGFDYSCISALYYQAFENSYNQLIWFRYADKLNNLEIDGVPFPSLLASCGTNRIKNHKISGFLDADYRDRKYYTRYDQEKNLTYVKDECMYGSFAKLIEKVCKESELDKFCIFFSMLAGFSNVENMLNDVEYMEIIRHFAVSIRESSIYRNNASHGGAIIDIDQCTKDKNTVLNDLEAVRKNSIGLIQQLLFLLFSRRQ